jgi:hypothetical protein
MNRPPRRGNQRIGNDDIFLRRRCFVAKEVHSWPRRAGSNHGKRWSRYGAEYMRGIIHVNFAESYHSLLKRVGTSHHVSEHHFPRYLWEFEFRWNNRAATDGERTKKAVHTMGLSTRRPPDSADWMISDPRPLTHQSRAPRQEERELRDADDQHHAGQ